MNHLIQLITPFEETTLRKCPPGLFVYNNELCFKLRESLNDEVEAYYMDGGYVEPHLYSGHRNDLTVTPVKYTISRFVPPGQLPLDQTSIDWADDLTDIEGERIMLDKLLYGMSSREDIIERERLAFEEIIDIPIKADNETEAEFQKRLIDDIKKKLSGKTLNQAAKIIRNISDTIDAAETIKKLRAELAAKNED